MRRSASNSLLGSGGLRGRIREADGHALADRRRRLLNRLQEDVGVIRVEQALELAATRVHALGHFALADAFLLHCFGNLPAEYALPGHGSCFLIESFLDEIGIERRAQMLILSLFRHSRSPSCVSRQGPNPDRASAAIS